jgi:hypothetical protein
MKRIPAALLGSRLASALLGAAVMGALGGIAWAAIPDQGGQIHVCYKPGAAGRAGGSPLTIIDTERGGRCASGQVAVAFNQQGPPGEPGQPGLSDGYVYTKTSTVVGTLGPDGLTVAELALPAGEYIVTANVSLENFDATDESFVACHILVPDGDTSNSATQISPGDREVVSSTGWARLSEPGIVRYWCELGVDLHGQTRAIAPAITAVAVEELDVSI